VGEDILQRLIVELLRPLIERYRLEQGRPAFVGADQFIYYEPFNSTARVAPDVYLLPGVEPDRHVKVWKTWETGISPALAIEIVSTDWRKDYAEAPERHAGAGTRELVIFDPWSTRRPRGDGVRWQIYRRGPSELTRVETSDEDRTFVDTLSCFLCVIGEGRHQRLRLATGPVGAHLFPTAEEAERSAKEAERAAKEAERAAKEAERAAKDAALARIVELEAELARRTKT